MMLSQAKPIADLDELRVHLQFAIGLELATIPLYLSALYSIPDGENTAASRVIQSVVIEEMLHMALAANVLNGIGGVPSTNKVPDVGDPIPRFPTKIPFLQSLGELHLRRFSHEALDTFMLIEHPADAGVAPPTGYGSIGAFYAAISKCIEDHCPDEVFKRAQKDRVGCQIQPEDYYGGAGKLIVVTKKKQALEAIAEIVRQGEGIARSVLKEVVSEHGVRPHFLPPIDNDTLGAQPGVPVDDGDVLADGWKMYSHYARFREIAAGRRYFPKQKVGQKPAGDVLPIDWYQVYPMADDPSVGAYAGTAIAPAVDAFAATYTKLLNAIYAAFNGKYKMLEAVTIMWTLKYEAVALMKTPSPLEGNEGLTVGAPFEYQRG